MYQCPLIQLHLLLARQLFLLQRLHDQAQSSGNTIRVQVKRRPTAPSLFPPLPPATLAVQQSRLAQQTQGNKISPTLKGVQIRKVDRPGQNWI